MTLHETQRRLKETRPDLRAGSHEWWDAMRAETKKETEMASLMGTDRKCRFFITSNLKPRRCERGTEEHLIHMVHLDFEGVIPIEITWRVDPPYIVE